MNKQNKKYKYTIDGKKFENETPIITGAELRAKGEVPNDYSIYMEIRGKGDDELIEENEEVDLSQAGREKFYSAKADTNNG